MIANPLRPEDRRRDAGAEASLWADTRPQCHRSEAFAEDLPPALPGFAGLAGLSDVALQAARSRRPMPGTRLGASVPMHWLGLALAVLTGRLRH